MQPLPTKPNELKALAASLLGQLQARDEVIIERDRLIAERERELAARLQELQQVTALGLPASFFFGLLAGFDQSAQPSSRRVF